MSKKPITTEELSTILDDMRIRATPFRGDVYLRPEEAITAILTVFELRG